MEGGYILRSKNMGVWVGGASEVSLPHMAAGPECYGTIHFPSNTGLPYLGTVCPASVSNPSTSLFGSEFSWRARQYILGWDFGKYFVAMMTQSFICRNLTTDLCFPDYLLCFQNQPIDQIAHCKNDILPKY